MAYVSSTKLQQFRHRLNERIRIYELRSAVLIQRFIRKRQKRLFHKRFCDCDGNFEFCCDNIENYDDEGDFQDPREYEFSKNSVGYMIFHNKNKKIKEDKYSKDYYIWLRKRIGKK